MSGDADDLGGAEGVEAVHQCDADMDFGGWSVEVSRGDALTKGFEAANLRFDAATGVVSCPSLPERPTVMPRGSESFVAGDRGGAIFFPRPAVLADRDGAALEDGGVATAGVIDTIGGHRANHLVLGIWFRRSGRTGLSPSRLGVNSTARMSDVAVSIARCTLRH